MRTELSTEPLSPEPNRIARSPAPPGAGVAPWTLPPAPPPAAEWQRYLAAALRFKWVVLGVTLASTALGVLGALLVKPKYVARATVWVQVPIRPARDEGPIWSGQLPISSGWMDLLQSYAVLDDVVRGLQLYVTPVEPRDSDALRGFHIKDAVLPGTYRLDVDSLGQRFTLTAHGREGVVQEGSVGDSVGAAIGFVWVPPASALTPPPGGVHRYGTVRGDGAAREGAQGQRGSGRQLPPHGARRHQSRAHCRHRECRGGPVRGGRGQPEAREAHRADPDSRHAAGAGADPPGPDRGFLAHLPRWGGDRVLQPGRRVGYSQHAVPAGSHVRRTARREGEPRGGPARPRDDRACAGAAPGVCAGGGCAGDDRLGAALHGAGAGAARPLGEAGGPAHVARALHRRRPGGAASGGGGGSARATDDSRACGGARGRAAGARAAARRARGCRHGGPAENPAPGGGRDAPAARRDTRRAGGGQPAAALRRGPAGRRQQPLRCACVGPRRGAPDARREPRADLRLPGAGRRSRTGGGRGRGPRLRRPPRAPPRSSHPAHGARDPRGGPARGLAQWQARGERGPGDRSAARHPPERGQPPRRRWTGGGDRHEPGPLGREIVRGLEPGARVRRRGVPHPLDRW